MPFPWKKVKSTRISQFVNDHLHNSQRRRDGSSLFVETGFPTSLVDLFIKNRQKLKKSSKKKHQIPPISPLNDESVPITAGSPTPFPSPSRQIVTGSHSPVHMHSPLHCPSPLRSPLHSPPPSVNRILVVDERDQIAERGLDANTVLLVVFKMFLVVILALCTKKLTVGITMSALLLFLLEYIGKHVGGLLKPLKSIVQSVRRLLRFKDVKLDENKGVVLIPGCSSSLESYGSKSLDQEIQVVESEDYFATRVDEIQPEGEVVDGSCFNVRLEYREIKLQEAGAVVVEEEKEESVYKVAAEFKRKSRGAKIKSKMKNLFPKKSRKEGGSQKHEDMAESESASESSSVSSRKYKEEDGMMRSTIYDSSAGFSEISEEVGVKHDEQIESGTSWKYLILGVIVLVGLIGGRTFALLLTLSWLLLLKFSKTMPMYTNVVPTSTVSFSDKKSI
ncbi:hypothetical protein MIMGU_mgv1a006346mg [Erythranthe guttata]|uniref:Uncharacterized protein n=1 Tax=Erythranthe guttata TaxID=4155 RepID=A0A022PWB4_ERYGU|nr:hypothetical protein MIMGU_mgv1a006346mg [Erythranthe guttata]